MESTQSDSAYQRTRSFKLLSAKVMKKSKKNPDVYFFFILFFFMGDPPDPMLKNVAKDLILTEFISTIALSK